MDYSQCCTVPVASLPQTKCVLYVILQSASRYCIIIHFRKKLNGFW